MSSFEKDERPAVERVGIVTGGLQSPFSRRNGLKGALGIAALTTLAACGGGNDDSGNGSGDGASGGSGGDVVVNGTEPQNPLVPTNTNEVGGGRLLDSLWAGLVYYKADGTPENDIADSIESTDAQNYTIKIKSGTKFSDGTAVTAKSFVDAWNYGALGTNAQLSSYFFEPSRATRSAGRAADRSDAVRLAVVDDTTFTVKLCSRSPTSRCAWATRRSTRCPSRPSPTSRRTARTRSATGRTSSRRRAPGSTTSGSTSSRTRRTPGPARRRTTPSPSSSTRPTTRRTRPCRVATSTSSTTSPARRC